MRPQNWDPAGWRDLGWPDIRFVGFGASLVFWSGIGQTYLIGFFGAELREAFSLTDGQYGRIYGAATFASGILILWTGGLVDRMPLGRIAAIVVLGVVIAGLTMAATPHWIFLLLSFFLLRQFGQALMGHVANASMGRYYERFKGRATGLLGIAYSAGELILPLFASLLIGQLALPPALAAFEIDIGWRGAFAVMSGMVALSVFPILPLLLRDMPARDAALAARLASDERENAAQPGSRRRQWTRAEVLRDPRFWLIVPMMLAQSGIFTGLFFHIVSVLQEKGWNPELWPYYWGFYPIAAFALNPVAGWLVDRFTATRLFPFTLLPFGLGLLLLGALTPFAAMMLCLFLLAVAVAFYGTSFNTLWPELYGVRHLGKVRTLSTTAMVFMSASGPLIMGALKDWGVSYSTQMIYGALFIFLASAVSWLALRHTDSRPLAKAS
ncbi:MAG: MFS transporter [Alphaproteobacteria bacterium]